MTDSRWPALCLVLWKADRGVSVISLLFPHQSQRHHRGWHARRQTPRLHPRCYGSAGKPTFVRSCCEPQGQFWHTSLWKSVRIRQTRLHQPAVLLQNYAGAFLCARFHEGFQQSYSFRHKQYTTRREYPLRSADSFSFRNSALPALLYPDLFHRYHTS